MLLGGWLAVQFGLVADSRAYLFTWLAESWVLLGVAIWLLRRVRAQAFGSRLQRLVVAALLIAVFLGQLSPLRGTFYPFTHWSMYTSPAAEVEYARFLLVSDGEVVEELDISALSLLASNRAILARLHVLLRATDDGDEQAENDLEASLRTISRFHDGTDFDTIEGQRCSVTGDRPVRTTCRTVLEVSA